MKKIETITKNTLDALRSCSQTFDKHEDILSDYLETRELLSKASSADISDKDKLLCDEKKYILFDEFEHKSLRVISIKTLDEVLKVELLKYHNDILRMVAVEKAHPSMGKEIFSTEYYEPFVTYLQALILQSAPTNWYLEFSDYIIDFLYIWLGEDAIDAYIANNIKNTPSFVLEKSKVDEVMENLSKKIEEIASIAKIIKYASVVQMFIKACSTTSSKELLDINDFLDAVDAAIDLIESEKNFPKKVTKHICKIREAEDARGARGGVKVPTLEENDALLKKTTKHGFKIYNHLSGKLQKMLESKYIGKETSVFIETGDEVEQIVITIDSVVVKKNTIELWNRVGDIWQNLQTHLDNEKCKNLKGVMKPRYPAPEGLQENLKENNMFYRVGDIVKMLKIADEDHEEFVSAYRGKEYVVVATNEDKELYTLYPLEEYRHGLNLEKFPKWKNVVAAFHDADFEYPKLGLHETDYVLISRETNEPIEGLDVIYGVEAIKAGEIADSSYDKLVSMTSLPVTLQKKYVDFLIKERVECEGCRKYVLPYQLSDVMEMNICNICEDKNSQSNPDIKEIDVSSHYSTVLFYELYKHHHGFKDEEYDLRFEEMTPYLAEFLKNDDNLDVSEYSAMENFIMNIKTATADENFADAIGMETKAMNDIQKFQDTHKGLFKTWCEVCGDAWAGTLKEVNYPHYACTVCRENDKTITFGNSIEFDNAEEYGN